MIERSDEIGGRVDKRPVEVKYHCVDFRAPHRHSDARPGTATQGPIMRSAFRSGHSGAPNGSCGVTIVVRSPSLHFRRLADRKSVVSGKSGSVRVKLGGRRIIKKKKNRKK